MRKKILVIDDDQSLRNNLKDILTSLGYETITAGAAVEGLQEAYKTKPNLIILDVMLPGMDGWQTCQRFREMSNVPILMLTALGSEDDVVKGLEMGADDYVVKPVTMRELGARVKALLRRAELSSDKNNLDVSKFIQYQDLIIDFDKHEVTRKNNRIDLSPTEFRLLSCLVKHQGRVLPHSFLLTQVWGAEYSGELDHLRLYISYLRRKIEDDPSKPDLIKNEWGIGYRFG